MIEGDGSNMDMESLKIALDYIVDTIEEIK